MMKLFAIKKIFIINKIEYMHNNPVKSQIVENPKDYRFSSYHQYNGVIRNTVQVAIVVP